MADLPNTAAPLEKSMPLATNRPVAPAVPNDLDSFWIPFTPNRAFKQAPRLITRAKNMHYYTPEGRAVLDGSAGLWCCNAGHNRDEIVSAIQTAAAELDFAPAFQYGHPKPFALASRLASLAPGDLDHVFFCNSGSEAADTALKIAIAYWNVSGQGQRQRLIGRERGYHGVGFGGISVGGIVNNRKFFGSLLAGVDHLPHTYNRAEQAFSRGEPEWGAHLADDLERIVTLHDASTIAAVVVEPMAGSTGVLPPPKGYLQRLRQICDRHGILLIFDEVITGFGRLGFAFAAERYGVVPDMITFAKGVNSGTVPMGGVIVRKGIHDAFMKGPEHVIELFHGYTYSAHPLACAAALATQDIYREEKLFERARDLEETWADAMFSLQSLPNVVDIRTLGLVGAIDLASKPDAFGARAYEAMERGFHDIGIMMRVTGDTIALSPPLVISHDEIGELVDKMTRVIKAVA
jgi:beta-alanine--pyruvate transaminase